MLETERTAAASITFKSDYLIQGENQIKIFKTKMDNARIISELVHKEVGVSSFTEKDDTLEDYFKKITGGEGIA